MYAPFRKSLIAGCLWLAFASVATAQAPDPEHARVHLGPLLLTPTIALTNIGVDTNVFFEPADAPPKQDFTLTVTPQADLWVHAGRTLFSAVLKEDLVWYATYSSERATNEFATIRWKIPFGRFAFTPGYGYLSTRERPGFEIDARSQRTEHSILANLDYKLSAKTTFGAKFRKVKIDFDKDAIYQNDPLYLDLNRTETVVLAGVGYQLTPLTNVSLDFARQEDRFEFSPLRDSDSTRVSSTVTLDPFALIKGRATLGYRDFEPLAASIPNFKGLVGAVDLSYVAFGTTKFGLRSARDIEYSYEALEPYYIEVGINLSLAQRLFGQYDAVGRVGWQHLEYRTLEGTFVSGFSRIDYVDSFGGGIGYHFGSGTRMGLDVDHQKRTSVFEDRRYEGWKIGMSVTYGF